MGRGTIDMLVWGMVIAGMTHVLIEYFSVLPIKAECPMSWLVRLRSGSRPHRLVLFGTMALLMGTGIIATLLLNAIDASGLMMVVAAGGMASGLRELHLSGHRHRLPRLLSWSVAAFVGVAVVTVWPMLLGFPPSWVTVGLLFFVLGLVALLGYMVKGLVYAAIALRAKIKGQEGETKTSAAGYEREKRKRLVLQDQETVFVPLERAAQGGAGERVPEDAKEDGARMSALGEGFVYDVFISYAHQDAEWVRGWLLPGLEKAGLRVCIDYRDFEAGVPSLVNMENAVAQSRKTLLVLTPTWVKREWTQFESLLIQAKDPAGRRARMIPLRLQDCTPPDRIAMLTYLDFSDRAEREGQLGRLVAQIKGKRKHSGEPPAPPPPLDAEVAPVAGALPVGKAMNVATVRRMLKTWDATGLIEFVQDHYFEALSGRVVQGMTRDEMIIEIMGHCQMQPNGLERLVKDIKASKSEVYDHFAKELYR